MATVSHLRSSPVKGINQTEQATLAVVADGLAADRRFVIVDAAGKALYGADLPQLAGATARVDEEAGTLEIRFADGETVTGEVVTAAPMAGSAYGGRQVPGVAVDGPWAGAIGARLGRPVTLMHAPVGTGAPGAITVIAEASIARIADALGVGALDPRRFKMNVEIGGVEAFAEDRWEGRDVAVGETVLRIGGPVPRCVLTTRDPDTQARDHDVLRAILAVREPMAGGEPPLGRYATVVRPGVIRSGDAVEVLP